MKHNIFEQNALDKTSVERPKAADRPKQNCFADFLVSAGLYDVTPINEDNISDLFDLIEGKARISVYCPSCKAQRVFAMDAIQIPWYSKKYGEEQITISLGSVLRSRPLHQAAIIPPGTKARAADQKPDWNWKVSDDDNHTRLLVFPFVCAMDENHRLDFVVLTDNNSMRKIGQYPTIADLTFPELDEFKTVINNTSRKELGTAIGLYANGVGVGSYVYLRRIFERILDEAKAEAELAGTVDLSGYDGMKVDKRIRLLKDYLPAMINDNHVFYGIVSKGIHELSEDECISYFPVLKEAIFMILRQWAQKKQEQEDAKRLRASLSQIASQVNS